VKGNAIKQEGSFYAVNRALIANIQIEEISLGHGIDFHQSTGGEK